MTYVDNVGVFHVQSDMERIGKYEIIGELGRGGMGVVYKARDPVIGRTVAIKVILKHLLHAADVKKRFYREARSAGQLSHDNITTIYNVDEEHGHPYLVMEYLEGQNLRQMLRDQAPLSFQQRIAIARQICRGLDYAHRNGVIHRDIKPENISVLPDGRVKIMDFGIARIQNEVQTLTQTNTSVGTPRYMSPEQIKGEPVDGRSDIFSFGVLFYELLTGQNPFAGAHVTTVIYKVLHAAPPSLDLEPGVLSSSLELIVGRCLSKEPGGRYGACAEIDRVLGALLSSQDEEVLASIPTSTGVMSSMVEPTIADEAVEMKAKPEDAAIAETMTSAVVSRPAPPAEETPEKIAADETMTDLVVPVYKPPAETPPIETAADETMTRPVVPHHEPLVEEMPEAAPLDETMTRLVMPRYEPPVEETSEEAAVDEMMPPPPAPTVEPERDETPVPVAPIREPRPPKPVGTTTEDKTLSNKNLIAVFAFVLVTVLAFGAYWILTNDPSSPPIAITDLPTEQGSGNLPNTDPEPNVDDPGNAETDAPSDETVVGDANQDNTMPSDDETPPDDATSPDDATPPDDATSSEEAARQAATNTRRAMDQARQRVASRGTEAEVADLFERAEQASQTGLAQLNNEDFEGAARSFGQARGLFEQVKQTLDEQDAQSDTGEAVIIDIEARTRADAESARTAMEAAKDQISSDRRQTPAYQEARSLEDRATQLFGANSYSRAFDLFGEAEAKYKEAAVAELSDAVLPEIQTAIDGYARDLKAAFEQEDGNWLKALSYRDQDWGAFFETAERVAAVVSPETVQASGETATVVVRLTLTYRDAENQSLQMALSHIWTLQNMGGDWMVTHVRPAP